MKYVDGDVIQMLLKKEINIFAHGCNCFCTMGAGIAAQVRQYFPMNAFIDLQTERGSEEKLGMIDYMHYEGSHVGGNNYDFVVINAYTQYKPGPNVDYDAIRSCFAGIYEEFGQGLRMPGDVKIGIPKIGAGIAGGDWDKIEKIIEEELKDLDVTVVNYVPMTMEEEAEEAGKRG